MSYTVKSTSELLTLMKRIQAEHGFTQQEFARSLNASPQYVSDVFNGRREPGELLLSGLGIRRQTVYTVPETLGSNIMSSCVVVPEVTNALYYSATTSSEEPAHGNQNHITETGSRSERGQTPPVQKAHKRAHKRKQRKPR